MEERRMLDADMQWMKHFKNDYPINSLDRIFRIMRAHSNDPAVQEAGLVCIWTLGTVNPNKPLLLEHGAGEVILETIKNHRGNLGVLPMALCAMKVLDGKLYTFNQMGAGDLVLSIMEENPHSPPIQHHGCSALRTLATSRPNSEKLMKNGAGDLILRAIHQHKDNQDVAKAVCGAVFSFSLLEENKEKIWKLGLMHFVLQAMNDHLTVDKVQEYGAGAIWSFGYIYCMMRLEAGRKIIKAYHQFPRNERIAEYVCGAIRSFAALKVNASMLMKDKAPTCLINILIKYDTKPGILAGCCYALWSLCVWAEFKKPLMDFGVGSMLLNLLTREDLLRQPEFAQAVGNIFGVITNLSTEPELAQELIDLGAIENITRAAKSFPKKEPIQTKVVCALRNLGYWGVEATHKLNSAKSHLLVQAAQRTFPQNGVIKKKGDEVLTKMNIRGSLA